MSRSHALDVGDYLDGLAEAQEKGMSSRDQERFARYRHEISSLPTSKVKLT